MLERQETLPRSISDNVVQIIITRRYLIYVLRRLRQPLFDKVSVHALSVTKVPVRFDSNAVNISQYPPQLFAEPLSGQAAVVDCLPCIFPFDVFSNREAVGKHGSVARRKNRPR